MDNSGVQLAVPVGQDIHIKLDRKTNKILKHTTEKPNHSWGWSANKQIREANRRYIHKNIELGRIRPDLPEAGSPPQEKTEPDRDLVVAPLPTRPAWGKQPEQITPPAPSVEEQETDDSGTHCWTDDKGTSYRENSKGQTVDTHHISIRIPRGRKKRRHPMTLSFVQVKKMPVLPSLRAKMAKNRNQKQPVAGLRPNQGSQRRQAWRPQAATERSTESPVMERKQNLNI
jgi:hypothetical protein